jgi:hypothetical protein
MPHGDGFVDVGASVPLRSQDVTRGISITDADGDCRMDFLLAGQWTRSALFLNRSTPVGEGICLRVVHRVDGGAPTPLIGATLTLHTAGTMSRTQLYPANGHSGVSGSLVHFAAPSGRTDLTVDVAWVDGTGHHTRRFPVHTGYQEVTVTP